MNDLDEMTERYNRIAARLEENKISLYEAIEARERYYGQMYLLNVAPDKAVEALLDKTVVRAGAIEEMARF